MSRLFPHPALTIGLTLIWQLLVNSLTMGNLLLGFGLGIVIPLLTGPYWPDRPRLKKPLGMVPYVLIVLWDICVANIAVARIVLFMPNRDLKSCYIAVPVDLTTPEAIAVLAGTITMTPGTLSADLSTCGRVLLVHCLHAPDPDAVRDEIKTRYESRLKEIFG